MSRQDTIGKHATQVTKGCLSSTVRYWSTDVVTVNWRDNTVTLDTGGFATRTTKLRMNQASREWGLGYHVYQDNWDWFIDVENGDKTVHMADRRITLDLPS